jgi:hypothetical protein
MAWPPKAGETLPRAAEAFGVCEVLIPIRGLGSRSERVVMVTTAWELIDACAAPRLVSTYIES